MSRHRNESPREQWSEGLARLEELTKQFQREVGRLQQVAADAAGEPFTTAAEPINTDTSSGPAPDTTEEWGSQNAGHG